MVSYRFTGFAVMALLAAGPVQAQDGVSSPVAMCDPLMSTSDFTEDEGNPEDLVREIRRYDLETAEVMTDERAIIDALFEEAWDPATGTALPRPELCAGQPAFVANWSQVMGTDDTGKPAIVAQGYVNLMRDGSFRFTYENRPYVGAWTMTGGRITLSAPWLNGGAPLESAVERVTTPVEYHTGNEVVTYDEQVYRIGVFRLLPINSTVKGFVQACPCATN